MPLRRSLPLALLVPCLFAAGNGSALFARIPFHRGAAPAADASAPRAADLLSAARPYLRDPRRLPDPVGFPADGAVELYHLHFERVLPNGLSAVVVQRVFQLRDAATARMFALDDLWYDTSRNRFQLITAEVRRDGRVLTGADLGNLRPDGTGNQPRHVALPDLQAGDRVNVVYVLLPDTSHDWSLLQGKFLGNLFAFRDSFPTQQVDYVLASPTPLATSAVGLAPPLAETRAPGPDSFLWHWRALHLPAFFSEPDGASITDRSPFVQVSGFQSWGQLASWYNGLLQQRASTSNALPLPAGAGVAMTPVDFHLPLFAAPALSAAPPADRTVGAIWGYLAPRLRYRGNETGIHAYVPAPVAQVAAAQQGDCKDGALLLATWLRAAGIEAYVALVRTNAMGQVAPVGPGGHVAATMAAFDHALVYIPATQQWIDTTAPDFLDSELPSSDQNSLALIIRPGESQLVRVPVAPAAANLTRRTVELTPAADGWLRAQGTMEVRGADAPDLRLQYADAKASAAVMRAWLQPYFPQARVQSVEVDGVSPRSDTVELRFVAEIKSRASLAPAWTPRHYAAVLATQAARTDLLRLPLRWTLDETWSLHLDGNSACSQYPPGSVQHRQGPYGQLSIATTCSQGVLSVHTLVAQTAEQIAPGEYQAFRGFWQSVDADLNSPIPRRATDLASASISVAGN